MTGRVRMLWVLIVGVSLSMSNLAWAETACETKVIDDLSARKINDPAVFYHDLGLCYFNAGFLDEGQDAWGKWLYLAPQGALTSADSKWFKEWEIAKREAREVSALAMKEVKKQMFGSSSTLAQITIEDPMSMVHSVRVQMSRDSYVLRAAGKMEILIPGDDQTQVVGLDRYGFDLIDMTLLPIIPEVRAEKSQVVAASNALPWWVWAAVGGISVAATGATLWLWLESRDDIHLKGRVEIEDAS